MTDSPETGKTFPLTDAQRAEIEPLKADKNWPEIYRRLETIARANSAIQVTVPNWYHLATQINRGEGPLANYVRFSMMLAAIRKGQLLTPIMFQNASDKLALTIVDRILKEGIPKDNAENLIDDVVRSTQDMSLEPEDWAGSAANSLKGNYGEWLNQVVALYRNLPYLDIGTFEGKVFQDDWHKFVGAALTQDTAAVFSQIYQRPQAFDFYLTGGLEFRESGGMLDGAGFLVPSDDKTQLRSPALRELFGDVGFADLSPEQKKKYLTVLRDDPRIGAAFGVEVASIDRLRLVNEAGVLRLNDRLTTTLTQEEATKRQQMASVRGSLGVPPPEMAVPPPTLAPSRPTENLPQGGFREGRAAMPRPALAFDFPAPPVFALPALPAREQMGINLAFSPPPTLMDDGEEPRRVPVRIPPSAPEDAPVTQKQLSAAQDELLLNLRVMEMSRPEPKLDPVALRKMIARETEWEARCGRTIYSYPL